MEVKLMSDPLQAIAFEFRALYLQEISAHDFPVFSKFLQASSEVLTDECEHLPDSKPEKGRTNMRNRVAWSFVCVTEALRISTAAMLTKIATRSDSEITFACRNKSCRADNILDLIAIGVRQGDIVQLIAAGDDAETVVEDMRALIAGKEKIEDNMRHFSKSPLDTLFVCQR